MFVRRKNRIQGRHTRATAYHQRVSAMSLPCAEAQGMIDLRFVATQMMGFFLGVGRGRNHLEDRIPVSK